MVTTLTKMEEPKRINRLGFKHQSDDLIYDKRYLPRWETSNKAFYRDDERHQIVVTQLRNLNLAGACLYVKDDVNVDQRLILKICLDEGHSFVAEGTVVWRLRDGSKTYAGCSFNHLDQSIQELILTYTL